MKTFSPFVLVNARNALVAISSLSFCFALFARESVARETAFAASIAFGDPKSEEANKVQFTGNSKCETLLTEMGGYQESFSARTLAGRGASARFSVPPPGAGQPLLLEIEEIHNRRPQAFGYSTLVNDKEIYFRSYQECGSGPNHYFIQVPAESIKGGDALEIKFRNEGSAPFSLSHVWAYHDFFNRVAGPEKVYRPMGILGFVLPKAAPRFECFSPIGKLSISQYGSGNVGDCREKFLNDLQQTARSGEMILWQPNGTLWGGKPFGPDGRGGYFSDPRYSALNFNADTGRYVPSWPSMWGSTVSPSLQEKWMAGFLERRFRKLLAGIPEEIDFLKARGTAPNLAIVREWGVSSCELSQPSIDLAKAAGLNLDASDGLDAGERRWMFRDGVRLWKDFAASTRGALERDSVQVDQGKVILPVTQTLDNLYSQPDFLSEWPVGTVLWSNGEQGMVRGLWASGELGQGKEYRELAMYDYLRARGRLSMVNMERTILKKDFSVLKNHYARGFQFVALFNDQAGDEDLIRKVDSCDDAPGQPVVHREPNLLAIDFRQEKCLGPKESIVTSENVQIAHDKTIKLREQRVPRLALIDPAKPGTITYRVSNEDAPFPSGLSLHLDGRISKIAGNKIEIFQGEHPEQLKLARTLSGSDLPTPDHWTMHVTSENSVDLGSAMVGKRDWYVRLVVHSPSASDAAFVLKLSIGSQWPKQSGYSGDNPLRARQERILQLWVQDRALAANLLEEYARAALASAGLPMPSDRTQAAQSLVQNATRLPRETQIFQKAAEQFERGWYRSAYEAVAGEISQILPARYAIRGGGRLGCYPVEAILPANEIAIVKLHALGKERVEFSLASDSPTQPIQLTFPDLDASLGDWGLEELGQNHYALSRSRRQADSRVSTASGKLSVNLAIQSHLATPNPLPNSLSGRFLRGDSKRITIDTQDLAAMDYEQSSGLEVAEQAVVERIPDRLADPAQQTKNRPQPMDAVSLTLNEQKQVVRIQAAYGRDRGRIKRFHPPVLLGDIAPGGIELENGRRYDFSFAGDTGTRFDTVALHAHITNYELPELEEALRPGQEVEITYCPYRTGDSHPRLQRVTQAYRVLLQEDFTKTTADEWKSKTFSVDRIGVVPHRPEPNYLYDVVVRLLRPSEYFQPGSVVYQVKSEAALGATALEFAARAFEDSSRAEFFTSPDGKEWTKAGQFDNTWQNCYPQSTDSKSWTFPPQVIDLTQAVKGRKHFLLKIQLTCGDADDRFCFGRFRVLTENLNLPEGSDPGKKQ